MNRLSPLSNPLTHSWALSPRSPVRDVYRFGTLMWYWRSCSERLRHHAADFQSVGVGNSVIIFLLLLLLLIQ